MAAPTVDVNTLSVKELSPQTWDAYAALIERHKGVWGGCWCTWFHNGMVDGLRESYEQNREIKRRLVSDGLSKAAVVFDGETAVGWAQYGRPENLPNIYHRKEWEASVAAGKPRPDWRITCFFVSNKYRRKGVAALALHGALELIAQEGGGLVEAYPEDTTEKDAAGKKISGSFLYSGTRRMFEDAGFAFDRPKGKKNTVMTITVAAA